MSKCTSGTVFACLLAVTCVAAIFLGIFLGGGNSQTVDSPPLWTWRCENRGTDSARCVKEEANETVQTLNRCQLTCGPQSVLFPATSVTPTIGYEVSRFAISNVQHSITAPSEVADMANDGIAIFRERINMYHPEYDFSTGSAPWSEPLTQSIADHMLRIQVTINTAEERITLTTDESYSLNIESSTESTTATITGATYFGVRHGLETLSQLINYDEQNDALQIVNSFEVVNDSPAFSYRGLMLDTSRNFFPVADIKRTIDGMSGSKLNILHWHITDSQAFPIVIESLPNMHFYGAYSPEKVYYRTDIQELVEYGRVRGVKIIPELDAPAHVGHGWNWGPKEDLGDLAVCVGKEPWWVYCSQPPCGQLNLMNDNMYDVLGAVYQELTTAFGALDLFHYGGDEINFECWNSTEEIVDWMSTVGDNGTTEESFILQWSVFQEKAHNLMLEANGGNDFRGILWSSSMTESENVAEYLNQSTYIIQMWTEGNDSAITELLQKGYDLIFSNYDAWYLDCGFSAWVGQGLNWCAPYKGWQYVYNNNPIDLVDNVAYNDQILGGETTLFAEQVDSQNLDSKLWPRVSAFGERMWTNPPTNYEPALTRMVYHRQRLVKQGIAAEVIQPEYCQQNEGKCYDWGVWDGPTE